MNNTAKNYPSEEDFRKHIKTFLESEYVSVEFTNLGGYRQLITYDKDFEQFKHYEEHSFEEIFQKHVLNDAVDAISDYDDDLIVSDAALRNWVLDNYSGKNLEVYEYLKYVKRCTDNEANFVPFLGYEDFVAYTNGQYEFYSIYQLKDDENLRDYFFRSYQSLIDAGKKVEANHYSLVYSGKLEGMSLDDLFTKFNCNHPSDYRGHSLSVSDIIVIEKEGSKKAYYVDSFGFEEVPQFLSERSRDVAIITDFLQAGTDYIANKSIDYNEAVATGFADPELLAIERSEIASMQRLLNYLYEKAEELEYD